MSKRMIGIVLSGLLTASLVAARPSWAQSSPSADSIINSLTPRGNMIGTTRGIRPMTSPPPAEAPATPAAARPAGHLAPRAPAPVPSSTPTVAPAAAPGAAASRMPASETPSVNLTVQFGNDSAQLTPAAMHTLDELGRALSSDALSSYRFRIEGHTDKLGTPEHNQSLSDMRAHAVVEYLVAKFHVNPTRLEAVGMGETHPLIDSPRPAEPRNRRVTVVNVGA